MENGKFVVAYNCGLMSPEVLIVDAVSEEEAVGKVLLSTDVDNVKGVRVVTIQSPGLSHDLNATVIKLLKEKKKIAAIRDVRAAKGWGLKESKAYVDNLKETYSFLF